MQWDMDKIKDPAFYLADLTLLAGGVALGGILAGSTTVFYIAMGVGLPAGILSAFLAHRRISAQKKEAGQCPE